MKETFFRAVNANTIRELLRIIKNYTDEKYIEDVLIELRELKDDTYQQDDIQEVINSLSSESNICPICGEKLEIKIIYETHYELEDNPKEEYMSYVCQECGFDSSEE